MGHGGGGHGGGHGFGGRRLYGGGSGWGWGGWWPWYDDDGVPWRRAPAFGQDDSSAASNLAGPATDPSTTASFLGQLASAAAAIRSPVSVSAFQQAYDAAVSMGEVTGPTLAVSGAIDPLTASVITSLTGGPSVGHEPFDGGLNGSPPVSYNERTRAALAELSRKRLSTIQRETALTWVYRARAAAILMRRAQAQGLYALAHHWLRDATEYAHEAVEHAALCGDGRVLREVRRLAPIGL